ncbi:hypothetical protein [Nocardiopsis synnemataformans]|uniref:hypothetical protein n=1 Tax=Nocardiopsis synnemataformans TaxID=61305 RepID=UPI003EB7A4D9
MSFEPTQPQDGVDPNPFTLIDPDTIPYPLTDVWSLNYAAETLRTGGEDLFGGAEDMSSTWGGLQSHYTAPESETLFAAMDPVLTRGEDIQSDLSTVASALEDLAEAAQTARRSLNGLRIEAQSLWNANHDKKVWWLNKDDETDEWAWLENIRIKDAVNTAWSTFNEAENACASRISAVFGGPAYASPDQAGAGDFVYGLPSDAGERDMSLGHHLSLEGVNANFNDFAAWAGSEFHPSLASFDNDIGQAVWDVVVTDVLWGSAVGLTSKLGYWHPDNGWRFDPSGRWENTKAAWGDAGMDAAALIGIHDEHGWLWDPGAGGREGWGSGWDRWTDNIEASGAEVWEGHSAWSTREDGVAYSNTTMATNAVMMTGGLPLKLVKIIAGTGVDVPSSGSDGSDSDGSDSGGSDNSMSQGGPGSGNWPSSPLPQRPEGSTPTGERFAHQLTVLQESLLDPNRFRETPSSPPNTPSPSPTGSVPEGVGDRPSQSPSAPQRSEAPQAQEGGTPPHRPSEEAAPRRPAEDRQEDGQEASRPREEEAGVPRGPEERPGAPAPTPRLDGESDRGDSGAPRAEDDPEQRPPRRDEDAEGDQGDERAPRRDDEREGTGGPREEPEAERPEPATGGGGGGGDEPPNDRTGTGGDEDDPDSGGDREDGSSEEPDSGDSDSDSSDYQSPEPGSDAFESRVEELMDDPAKKNDNPTQHQLDKARREAEVGLAAERQGLVPGPIQRAEIDNSDPAFQRDQGDIIDGAGQSWDIKGFRDTFPAGPRAGQPMPPGMRGGFDINRIENEIRGELENGENVLLDITGIALPENLRSLRELIKNNPEWDGKVIIVEEGE